jgi:two-component system, NtrC family, response regulator HydG
VNVKQADILVIDDDKGILTSIYLFLKSEVNSLHLEQKPSNILSLLKTKKFSVVILDMNFSAGINNGNEGLYWMQRIKAEQPDALILLMTAYADIDLAIRSLKEGASDFLIKPWKNEQLLNAIKAVCVSKKDTSSRFVSMGRTSAPLIGESESMQALRSKLAKAAPTDANVLILGENGTGKEVVAHLIHQQSLRVNYAFVKIDVGALSEQLFESELFGYKKGAFTDAKEDRKGRIEDAHLGSLFLDEIGNITRSQQSKLLSVLQNREVIKLGSSERIIVDIRLICATNIALKTILDERHFRQDLMYRINTIELMIPPLRDRKDDIGPLAKYFLSVYGEKYNKPFLQISDDAIYKLQHYAFPGNVRELQYCIERAVILSETEKLKSSDFDFTRSEHHHITNAKQEINLKALEKQAIIKAIEKHKGNISKAAKELGITRTSLYRKIGKHDV